MIRLLFSTLREKKMTVLCYSVAGLALLFLYIAIYPSIKHQMDAVNDLIKTYPPALMKAFNFQDNAFSTLGGYLSTETFGVMWPLLMVFLVVSSGASLISGEIELGTIGLILSLPLSRVKIFWAKYLAVVASLVIFIICSIIAIIPIAALFSSDISAANVMKLAGVGFLFGLAVMGLAFFMSSWFSEKGRVNGFATLIVLLMYVLNLVANLKDNLSKLKYFSFFHYYNPSDLLRYGTVDHKAIAVFASVAVISTVAGLIIFNRRDIAV